MPHEPGHGESYPRKEGQLIDIDDTIRRALPGGPTLIDASPTTV